MQLRAKFLVILFSVFMLFIPYMESSYAFWDFGGWEKKYNLLFDENQELKNEIKKLELKVSKILKLYDTQKHKIDVLNNDVSNLESKSTHWKDQTYEYYDKLLDSNVKFNDKVRQYDVLSNTVDNLESKNQKADNILKQTEDKLKKSYDKISNQKIVFDDYVDEVEDYIDDTEDYIDNLKDRNTELYDEAYKPRIEIEKTKLKWGFHDSKGNDYHIIWDISSYEKIKVYSDKKSITSKPLKLNLNDERTIRTTNLDGFVNGNFVSCCIDQLYENSESNSDFIWEVWYIVSQMTIYDKDVDAESEGRYALETIHRGGGDCEDLVILIADMIKSSSHTKDWVIKYIYMDIDNPNDPQTVNHIILYVNDGQYDHYIEATGKPSWDYYPNGINGWFIDV